MTQTYNSKYIMLQVTWRKKSEAHPLTIGLFTFVGDTRITVDYNQRTNEWSLIIQDVKPSDEGIYQCQISTKQDNLNTYDVRLNVKSKSNVKARQSVVCCCDSLQNTTDTAMLLNYIYN